MQVSLLQYKVYAVLLPCPNVIFSTQQFAFLLLILAYLHIYNRPYSYSITEKNSIQSRRWSSECEAEEETQILNISDINMGSGHRANNLDMNGSLTSGQLIKDIPIRNTNVGEQRASTWRNFLKVLFLSITILRSQ